MKPPAKAGQESAESVEEVFSQEKQTEMKESKRCHDKRREERMHILFTSTEKGLLRRTFPKIFI